MVAGPCPVTAAFIRRRVHLADAKPAPDSQLCCDDCCTECSKVDSFSKSLAVGSPNENERHDAQVVSLRTLSYVWGSCRNAFYDPFRPRARLTPQRPKAYCD